MKELFLREINDQNTLKAMKAVDRKHFVPFTRTEPEDK